VVSTEVDMARTCSAILQSVQMTRNFDHEIKLHNIHCGQTSTRLPLILTGRKPQRIRDPNVTHVELRMSSTKGGGNSLQTCNVLYYYLNYLYYIKQLDIEQ